MIIGISKGTDLKEINDTVGTEYTRLKYSDPVGVGGGGKGPLIELKAPESAIGQVYNDLYPVKARVDDTVRITKMLLTRNGLRWEGHMAALNTIQNQHDSKHAELYGGGGSFWKSLGKSLITGAMTTVATVGQTAVAGTGVHFTPFIGRAYTEPLNEGTKFIPKMKSGNLFVSADAISAGTGIGIARPATEQPTIADVHNVQTLGRYRVGTDGRQISRKTLLDSVKEIEGPAADTLDTNVDYTKTVQEAKYEGLRLEEAVNSPTITRGTVNMRTEQDAYYTYPEGNHDSRKSVKPEAKYTSNKPYGYGNGTSGSNYVRDGAVLYGWNSEATNNYYKEVPAASVSSNLTTLPADGSNELRLSGLIPFYISSISPTKRVNCVFEANLDSYSDDYTGQWEDVQYVGRADKFHVYSGFERKVQFAFKVAAKSKDNLVPIYSKLNYLAGTTAPTYDKDNVFMRGTLVSVRVGDILKDQIGIFTGVGFKWDINVPWELGDQAPIVVPHMLTVNVSFTPIHSFVPTADSIYFGGTKDILRK